jgi:peptide/nickel transport system ATP-binding protein
MELKTATEDLIRVERLKKYFPVHKGLFQRVVSFVHAVDDISFEIKPQETFGLVGESGCGKTTTGKLLTKLIDPSDGRIWIRDPRRVSFVVQRDGLPLGAVSFRIDEEGTPVGLAALLTAPGASADELQRQSHEILTTLSRRPQGLSRAAGATAEATSVSMALDVELDGHRLSLLPVSQVERLGAPQAQVAQPEWESWLEQTRELEYIDFAHLTGPQLKEFRREVQMIFQDPYESLNPRMTIFDIVAEPLAVQRIGTVTERELRVAEMLELVGLSPPESFLFRYPHELSGGQRQRVAIARAMIINPAFIVADEPTSMLDVSIRTGVMKLMMDLQREFGISYLYITHDLAVARYMCERIAVMYLGKIVEMGPTEEVLQNPLHPYTKALIAAVPVPDPTFQRESIELKGDVPSPIDPPPQCRFLDRCPITTERCRHEDHPPLEEKQSGHYAACYEV